MKTAQSGVDLIKLFEGLRCTAYYDSAGVLTIGYGHTGPEVVEKMHISPQQAENILRKDLKNFEQAVNDLVKVPLNQSQFDALVSFTFNLGAGSLAESTLLKRLNNKEDLNNVAKEEFPRWNKIKGVPSIGLSRRRSAEVELFCQEPPWRKIDMADITSVTHTFLKKLPAPSDSLKQEEKARVYQGRTIKNCTVLDRKNNHTYLELGFGLGKWWVFDPHWTGLETRPDVKPYAVDKDLRYLRNFPYFPQLDNGPEGWRECQSSSIAMCLKYLEVPGIVDDKDYLKITKKYGDTTEQQTHRDALKELKVSFRFTVSADSHDIKKEIDEGRPVVAGVLHHGHVTTPKGGGHYMVITGYGLDYWLVQDPYGELDLVNGGWAETGHDAGKNIHYSFKNLNPRLFVGGGANGWCWLSFKKNKDG